MKRFSKLFPLLFLFILLILTSAISAPAKSDFKFVVLGDTRGGPVSPVYSRMIEKVNQLSPAFTIILGDFVDGTADTAAQKAMFEVFLKATSKFKNPVYYVTGNHDIYGSQKNWELYKEMFGKTYYSMNRAGAHFIILDSEIPGKEGRIAGSQLIWLKRDLDANINMKYKFVFLHEPFFPAGPHIGSSMDRYPAERDNLLNLIEDKGVSIIFSGHEHLYKKSQHEKITEIITGGGGAPLYGKPEEGGFYNFILVTIGKNGVKTDMIEFK